jgi:hypothetical protein
MLLPERVDMSTTAVFNKSCTIEVNDIEPLLPSPERGSLVYVVFTSINWTLKALEKARELAGSGGAKIVVVVLQVVPFPVPLDRPPIPTEFIVRRLEEKADIFPERTHIAAYLCRNPMEAFKRILNRNSPVIIGVKKRWLPSRDERLAHKLQRAGYDVTLVKTE